MKKYEFTGEVKNFLGRTLHQIRAVISFGGINVGDLGGWIEKESNLSHSDNAWVSGNARVFGNARVSGNAQVFGNARVFGDAQVFGNAQVFDDAQVFGDAQVCKSHHYLTISPIGSRSGVTTFFRTKELGISVACGCFRGTIEEFTAKVIETHGDNNYAKQYAAAIELAKVCIDLSPDEK